jgi:D-serine deaminase-like pyridoxal phosphate-dependent protein
LQGDTGTDRQGLNLEHAVGVELALAAGSANVLLAGFQTEEAAVALSRQEFVEFMAAAASAGGARLLEEERVLDAIKVFALLHLGSIRASAGVLPT